MYNSTPLLEYSHFKHRFRVKKAKKFIDDSPPILHMTNFMKIKRNYADMTALSHNIQSNINILEYFGRINLLGRKESWNDTSDAQWLYSRLVSMQKSVQSIEKANKFIAHRIQSARRFVSTNLKRSMTSTRNFRAPYEILEKYDNEVKLPKGCIEQRLLLRPIVYFEMEVVGLYPIGRFTIQLYTEALPQVVLAFVRVCMEDNLGRLTLQRSFSDLWSEFELKLDPRDITWTKAPTIEYDKRALDHKLKSGVLSFSLKHIDTLRKGILSFSLSYRPLAVDMKDRVAFGILIGGMRGLYLLESNGNKNGKPINEVIVTAMGSKTYGEQRGKNSQHSPFTGLYTH